MAALYLVPRTSDWAVTATMSATTSASGYPASNAQTDDLQAPWWATSGTATLTVTLTGSLAVNFVALIGTNADDGRAITVGGLSGVSLTGDRDGNGRPIDLVATLATPQTVSAVTFAIASNSVNWSVARVIVGSASTLPNFLDGFTMEPLRPQYSDENDFGHEIRYDLGIERWKGAGQLVLTKAQMVTLDAWWRATKGGFYPTVIAPDPVLYPPVFGRVEKSLPRTHDRTFLRVGLTFTGQAYAEVV